MRAPCQLRACVFVCVFFSRRRDPSPLICDGDDDPVLPPSEPPPLLPHPPLSQPSPRRRFPLIPVRIPSGCSLGCSSRTAVLRLRQYELGLVLKVQFVKKKSFSFASVVNKDIGSQYTSWATNQQWQTHKLKHKFMQSDLNVHRHHVRSLTVTPVHLCPLHLHLHYEL